MSDDKVMTAEEWQRSWRIEQQGREQAESALSEARAEVERLTGELAGCRAMLRDEDAGSEALLQRVSELIGEVATWKDRAALQSDFKEAALARNNADTDLLRELVDEGECSYDHHGYCQTHTLDPKPCPHERAKARLNAPTDAEQECDDPIPQDEYGGRWSPCGKCGPCRARAAKEG